MESDNDRPVKRVLKTEVFFWALLAILSPLVNSITFFFYDPQIWGVLFLASLVVFPAYILHAEIFTPRYFFSNKPAASFLISISFFVIIHVMLFIIYSVVLKFPVSTHVKIYFEYNTRTVGRESLWIIINMLLAIGFYFIKKSSNEKGLLAALERDNIDYKLKSLRSQLNPHFLFNTLNSIYSLSLQKSDRTPEVVIKLADLLRYMIYDCNEKRVLLTREIEFIQNYIEIEKIRYKADVRFTVEGDTQGIMIEPLLFISFIENGFKHAFTNAYTNAFVFITIKVRSDHIALSVVNNSNVDLETQAKKIQGTGIKNSKSLLEFLYPSSYELDIILTDKEAVRNNGLRIKHAKERLQTLYPDSHTLDVILSNNAYTVSLIIKPQLLDKMHHS